MPLGADVVPQLVPQFKDMFLPLKPIVPHLHRLLEFHHVTYKKKFKQTESSPSGTNHRYQAQLLIQKPLHSSAKHLSVPFQ